MSPKSPSPASWKPGQSGNPSTRIKPGQVLNPEGGRAGLANPARRRQLTIMLEQALARKVAVGANGSQTEMELIQWLAEAVTEAAVTGQVRFLDGRVSLLKTYEWWDMVKWVFQRLDPQFAKMSVDLPVGGDGKPTAGAAIYVLPANGRELPVPEPSTVDADFRELADDDSPST